MSYKTHSEIMNRVIEHNDIIESMGYEIIGTFLQGSYNYGNKMSDDESDIDTKCIIIPSFEDICLNKKLTSFTHVCENDEHIDVKDLRLYIQCFKKQNVNFVEILFTDYFVLNPKYIYEFNELILNREKIGRYDIYSAIKCISGMAYEKNKALTHRYPSLEEKIDKYGFDGKQLSHIIRLYDFLLKYMNGDLYKDCLIPSNPEYLLNLKRNRNIGLNEAIELSEEYVDKIDFLGKSVSKENHNNKDKEEIDSLFNDVIVNCLKIKFKEDLEVF